MVSNDIEKFVHDCAHCKLTGYVQPKSYPDQTWIVTHFGFANMNKDEARHLLRESQDHYIRLRASGAIRGKKTTSNHETALDNFHNPKEIDLIKKRAERFRKVVRKAHDTIHSDGNIDIIFRQIDFYTYKCITANHLRKLQSFVFKASDELKKIWNETAKLENEKLQSAAVGESIQEDGPSAVDKVVEGKNKQDKKKSSKKAPPVNNKNEGSKIKSAKSHGGEKSEDTIVQEVSKQGRPEEANSRLKRKEGASNRGRKDGASHALQTKVSSDPKSGKDTDHPISEDASSDSMKIEVRRRPKKLDRLWRPEYEELEHHATSQKPFLQDIETPILEAVLEHASPFEGQLGEMMHLLNLLSQAGTDLTKNMKSLPEYVQGIKTLAEAIVQRMVHLLSDESSPLEETEWLNEMKLVMDSALEIQKLATGLEKKIKSVLGSETDQSVACNAMTGAGQMAVEQFDISGKMDMGPDMHGTDEKEKTMADRVEETERGGEAVAMEVAEMPNKVGTKCADRLEGTASQEIEDIQTAVAKTQDMSVETQQDDGGDDTEHHFGPAEKKCNEKVEAKQDAGNIDIQEEVSVKTEDHEAGAETEKFEDRDGKELTESGGEGATHQGETKHGIATVENKEDSRGELESESDTGEIATDKQILLKDDDETRQELPTLQLAVKIETEKDLTPVDVEPEETQDEVWEKGDARNLRGMRSDPEKNGTEEEKKIVDNKAQLESTPSGTDGDVLGESKKRRGVIELDKDIYMTIEQRLADLERRMDIMEQKSEGAGGSAARAQPQHDPMQGESRHDEEENVPGENETKKKMKKKKRDKNQRKVEQSEIAASGNLPTAPGKAAKNSTPDQKQSIKKSLATKEVKMETQHEQCHNDLVSSTGSFTMTLHSLKQQEIKIMCETEALATALKAQQQAKIALLTMLVANKISVFESREITSRMFPVVAGTVFIYTFVAVLRFPIPQTSMFYEVVLGVSTPPWKTTFLFDDIASQEPWTKEKEGRILNIITNHVNSCAALSIPGVAVQVRAHFVLPSSNCALALMENVGIKDNNHTIVPDCFVDYYLGHVVCIVKHLVDNVDPDIPVHVSLKGCATIIANTYNAFWNNPRYAGRFPDEIVPEL